MVYCIDTQVAEDQEIHCTQWYYDTLKELSQHNHVNRECIGNSNEGNPVYALHIDATNKQPQGCIVVVAGHHAKEPAGPEAAIAFAQHYIQSETTIAQQLKEQYNVIVIPVIDIDGFSREEVFRRYNYDFNEDYHLIDRAPLTQQAVAKYIQERSKEAPLCLAFDLHEGFRPYNGFALFTAFPKDKTDLSLEKHIMSRLEKDSYTVNTVEIPEKIQPITYVDRPGGFDMFCAELGAYAFTFESQNPDFTLQERIETHLTGIDEGIRKYLEKTTFAKARSSSNIEKK